MEKDELKKSKHSGIPGNLAMYEKKITSQERKIYDLSNLISLGMSLASNLNIETLVESILFSCMGQMFIDKIAILLQIDIDELNFIIYMSKGYDETFDRDTIIFYENSPIIRYFEKHPEPCLFADIATHKRLKKDCEKIAALVPELIVPMKSKDMINGILILTKRLTGDDYEHEERDFLKDLAKFAAIAVENSRLYLMATLDRMTRLYIHHYFQERLLDSIKRSKRNKHPLSLLMIDIDHFKNFNDTYVHQLGDSVLKEVARILKGNIRCIDIAARYGGEEFAIILPDINLDDAMTVAERLRSNIDEHRFQGKDEYLHVTISIGIAQFDIKNDLDKKDFIERADKALYKAKKQGRNRVAVQKT